MAWQITSSTSDPKPALQFSGEKQLIPAVVKRSYLGLHSQSAPVGDPAIILQESNWGERHVAACSTQAFPSQLLLCRRDTQTQSRHLRCWRHVRAHQVCADIEAATLPQVCSLMFCSQGSVELHTGGLRAQSLQTGTLLSSTMGSLGQHSPATSACTLSWAMVQSGSWFISLHSLALLPITMCTDTLR